MDQQQHNPADDPAPVGPHHHEPGPVEVPAGEVGDLDAIKAAFYEASRIAGALYMRIVRHPDHRVRALPVALDD